MSSIQPGTGYGFTSSGYGSTINIFRSYEQDDTTPSGAFEQFQIVVQPYEVVGVDSFSIIRVVKGEVLWRPKLLPTVPPSPAPVCNKQFKITNWFSLPAFPIIDDDNSIFIGDGGIRVMNSAGVDIGIYVFKQMNAATDSDPIIVATADYAPACPVVAPVGLPELPDQAVWEIVKIGSLTYVSADPEANPPVPGGWSVTQNYIGSISLPSANNAGGDIPPAPGSVYRNQFEAVVTSVEIPPVGEAPPTTETRLQIVKGTALWSDGNCQQQTFVTAVDPRSPVSIVNGSDVLSPFMNDGGWVVIGAGGTYEVYLFNIKSQGSVGLVYDQVLYVCEEGAYNNACPVVLPTELAGDYTDYEAQCIRVAFDITPTSVQQEAVGTLAFKAYKDENDHPFKIRAVFGTNATDLRLYVTAGTINNIVPCVYGGNPTDPLLNAIPQPCSVIPGGAFDHYDIYIRSGRDPSLNVFPTKDRNSNGYPQVWYEPGETQPPDDTKTFSYICLGRVTVDNTNLTTSVMQYVTGSLWADRIQVGSGEGEKAYYYYARV